MSPYLLPVIHRAGNSLAGNVQANEQKTILLLRKRYDGRYAEEDLSSDHTSSARQASQAFEINIIHKEKMRTFKHLMCDKPLIGYLYCGFTPLISRHAQNHEPLYPIWASAGT